MTRAPLTIVLSLLVGLAASACGDDAASQASPSTAPSSQTAPSTTDSATPGVSVRAGAKSGSFSRFGTVKWFNQAKGFGFVAQDNGGNDIFVHIAVVERAGYSTLKEGQRVSYEAGTSKGKEYISDIHLE